MRRRFYILLSWVVSGYCMAALIGNTLFFTALAFLLRPFMGPRVWNDLFRSWARASMVLGRYECRITGAAEIKPPVIIAANHRSVFDIALLAAHLPSPVHFVARENLLKAPIIGLVLRKGRHLVVPGPEGAAGRGLPILRQAAERLKAGGTVIFFPEGHRSRDGKIQPFKPGAFKVAAHTGCPLVAVSIAGTDAVVPKGSRRILPWRMAMDFQEPTFWTAEEAGSAARREEVRQSIVKRIAELQPSTGPKLAFTAPEADEHSTLESRPARS